MARPPKTNADYFPHDAHMRNDPKVLALRRKHGLTGYAVYAMTIEALTNASNFQLDISPMGREILAGDFGIDEATFDTILRYCVQIDLFQMGNDVLTCKTLNNRLVFLINRRVSDDINYTKTPQKRYSKVKESKVKQMNTGEDFAFASQIASFLNKPYPKERGMNGAGQDVDTIIAQFTDRAALLENLKAMKSYYALAEWKMPTTVPKIIDTLMNNDYVRKLKEADPEQQAKIKQDARPKRQPEPDTIGTSAPGSLE